MIGQIGGLDERRLAMPVSTLTGKRSRLRRARQAGGDLAYAQKQMADTAVIPSDWRERLQRTLVHHAPEMHADDSLEDAVRALAATDDDGLPILDPDSERVVGWLTNRRLPRAYHAHIDER